MSKDKRTEELSSEFPITSENEAPEQQRRNSAEPTQPGDSQESDGPRARRQSVGKDQGPDGTKQHRQSVERGQGQDGPKQRKQSLEQDLARKKQRRQSLEQDQAKAKRKRRLSSEPKRAQANEMPRVENDAQRERRGSAEKNRRRSVENDPATTQSPATDNLQVSTTKSKEDLAELQRTQSDELAERMVKQQEAASFKSHQTIMRRRRRRNPYANDYERHYIPGERAKKRHKRTIKEIGIPCSSSETGSSDMSRISNLSEFAQHEPRIGFKILYTMMPILIFANLFGQFPITWRRNKKNGTVFYYFSKRNPMTYIFILIGIAAFTCWSLSVYNYYVFQMNVPNGTRIFEPAISMEDRRTQMLIDRNLFTFFVVMLNYMAVWIITLVFLANSRTVCNYLNYWSRAMILIKMDPTAGGWQTSIYGVVFYAVITVTLIWLHFCKYTATAVGGPTVTGILLVRTWVPHILEQDNHKTFPKTLEYLQWIGSFIVVYVYMAPKVYLLLFLFKQRLLQNCFQKWNGRAYAGSLMNDTKINKVKGRCTYRLLFRDHCVLVDLLQETSRAFAGIIEAALITDCIGICLFLYLFARDWKYGKRKQLAVVGNYFVRPYDWVTVFVFLTGSVIMDVIAGVVAAEVGETAGEGMDIIRRMPMVGRRQDEDLLFVLSMYASFNSHNPLEFNGANLFFINKDFVQEIASTIFSYFIILLQFMPPLDTDHDSNLTLRTEIGTFLRDFERLKDGHWQPVKKELEFETGDAVASNVSARMMATTDADY